MTQSTKPKASKEATNNHENVHPISRYFLWLDTPIARKAPFWIFGAGALVLLGAEYLHPMHSVSNYDGIFGFYELEGFFGFSLAVLMGWPLRKLLGRKEDYYDQDGDDD